MSTTAAPIHCPTCRNPVTASREMVPGFVVYGCRTCRKYAVDVPGTSLAWRPGGEGAIERLRAEAARASQWERARTADENSPAWESIA